SLLENATICLFPLTLIPLLPPIYSRAQIYKGQVAVFDLTLRLFRPPVLRVGFVCQVNKPDSWEYNFDGTVIQNEMTKYGLSGAGIEKRTPRDRKNHQKRKSWQESFQTLPGR